MRLIDKILGWVVLAVAVIGGVVLIAMTLLIVCEIIRRVVYQSSFMFVEEFSGYMVLVVLAAGVGLALRDGALLRVDFIFDRLGDKAQSGLQLVYDLLALTFCGIVAYQTTLFAFKNYSRGIVAATVTMTPLYLPQMLLAAGIIIFCLALLNELLQRLAGRRAGADKQTDPEPMP